MKNILLISLVFILGCTMGSQTDNDTVVQQLIEPPDMRTQSIDSAETSNQGMNMSSNPFQHRQWQLVSYASPQGMQTALPGKLATIQFANQKISGSTGCNRYFASYQLIGVNTLKISHSGLTMMACPESTAKQEQQFLKNLADINFYQFQGAQLQLLDTQNQVLLIFQGLPEVSLEQTLWQMTGLNNGKGGVVSSAQTRKADLQFIDGRLIGNSGCNSLIGRYQTNGATLKIDAVSMTRKYCADKELMTQEQQLSHALTQVSRYQIGNNQLRLMDAKGALLMSLKQLDQ